MPTYLLKSIDNSESYGPELRRRAVGPSGSLNEENDQSSRFTNSKEEFDRKLEESFRDFVPNLKAFASRFVKLSRRPDYLAQLILDFWSLLMSVISSGRQSGPDLLYPLSSLKKQKSGRLARLLLEHSRDLPQRNLHAASSSTEGFDPPRVAVIDLNEVPQEIIESGYTMSADSHGLVLMILFFESLITLLVHLFTAVDGSPFTILANWTNGLCLIVILCVYAIFRGEGTLTLVRRSDVSTPGCAVLLDRDFAVVVTGAQNIVEAIAESSFSISHPAWRHELEAWQFGQLVFYEALKTLCQWAPFAILTVSWLLLLRPTSLLMACLPLGFVVVLSFFMLFSDAARIMNRIDEFGYSESMKAGVIVGSEFFSRITPTFLLISAYEVVVAKDPLFRGLFHPAVWLHHIPTISLIALFVSSRNYHIRPAKLLHILGHPPVQRWEFDTLAAAATFQCLVLCRGIHRPVKSIDVLTLLDTLVPDQRDVWKAWKERVADRIAYEIDISFAPTLPTFSDQRQKHLKELLDQARIGYTAYREFYDWNAPPHSTIAL